MIIYSRLSRHFYLSLALFICCQFAAAEEPINDDPFHRNKEAWTAFRSGEYHNVKEILDQIDVDLLTNKSLKASFRYLEGVYAGLIDPSKAIELLEEARDLYTELVEAEKAEGVSATRAANIRGVHGTRSALILQYMALDQFNLAETELNAMPELFEYSPGFGYHLKARIAMFQGRYDEALAYGRKSLGGFEERDERRAAQARVNLGLYTMLTKAGLNEGLKLTLGGQGGLTKNADTDQYYYSLVNLIVYHKCKNGSEAESVRQTLEARLENEYDLALHKLYDWAVSLECPSFED